MENNNELNCNDRWYQILEEKYGYLFCLEAGYFDEPLPYKNNYSSRYTFPHDSIIIQFSGAFHPFHEGHKEMLFNAIDEYNKKENNDKEKYYIIHVDHYGYRSQKGQYNEDKVIEAVSKLEEYNGFKPFIIMEDEITYSCSRNFTKLYNELLHNQNDVYFLCGGDRANFALSFIDMGKCIVSGREESENYKKYNHLKNDRIWFVGGNNKISSTIIRDCNGK